MKTSEGMCVCMCTLTSVGEGNREEEELVCIQRSRIAVHVDS